MRKRIAWLTVLSILALAAPRMTRSGTGDPDASRGFILKHSQRITAALRAYADTHNGNLPQTLDDLVTSRLLEPQHLVIDLMDGKPPVRWIYLGNAQRKTPALVLMSPSLSNAAGRLERFIRYLAGLGPLPPESEHWICAWLDGSSEAITRGKLKWVTQETGIAPPEAPQAIRNWTVV